jgi:hypothetical protein
MIHYHGAQLSGPERNVAPVLRRRHAMVSFAAPRTLPIVAEVCQSFTLDNGAFSAWRSGDPITDWQPYRLWVEQWARHPAFDWCLIPDVIDGNEADNDALLADWADTRIALPIWHLHESLDRLERLAVWPRLALGSSGEYAVVGDTRWWSRMGEAMDVLCDEDGRPRTKLHGLRMLNPTVFSYLPLSSADSTNVARNVGLDSRWDRGPYPPLSIETRAGVLMERIEMHASASYWNRTTAGVQENLGLIG